MNKISIILLVTVLTFGLAVAAQSAVVIQINFESATGTDIATYTPGAGDVPAAVIVTKDFNAANPLASPIDYGLMGPSGGPYTDSGDYPDIVDDAAISAITGSTGGFGGNAMFTAEGTVANPTQHIGWYIEEDNGVALTGDFTAEVMFMIPTLLTDHFAGTGSEWGLQNIMGTEALENLAGNAALWKFRIWPLGGGLAGDGKMQLWTHDGGGENDIDGPAPVAINTWNHVACTYDATANLIELFYNGASYGSLDPGWANENQNEWWLGEWPNNPAPRGMTGWIDSVAISDTVLAPGTFVLPGTNVDNWYELY